MKTPAEVKERLKDLARIMPNKANENQVRSVAFHVEQAAIYIQRIVEKQDNIDARAAKQKKADKTKYDAVKARAHREKKKNEAEIEIAKVDPPKEGEIDIKKEPAES